MRINKIAAAALLGISALGLSACATGLRTQVSRFQAMPAPQGQSFVVVPTNPADMGGLEFSRYAEVVAQNMQAQGYTRAPSIDQATGIPGPDPLDILQTYRANPRMEGAVCLGMNCIVTAGAGSELHLGQELTTEIAF